MNFSYLLRCRGVVCCVLFSTLKVSYCLAQLDNVAQQFSTKIYWNPAATAEFDDFFTGVTSRMASSDIKDMPKQMDAFFLAPVTEQSSVGITYRQVNYNFLVFHRTNLFYNYKLSFDNEGHYTRLGLNLGFNNNKFLSASEYVQQELAALNSLQARSTMFNFGLGADYVYPIPDYGNINLSLASPSLGEKLFFNKYDSPSNDLPWLITNAAYSFNSVLMDMNLTFKPFVHCVVKTSVLQTYNFGLVVSTGQQNNILDIFFSQEPIIGTLNLGLNFSSLDYGYSLSAAYCMNSFGKPIVSNFFEVGASFNFLKYAVLGRDDE